MTSKAEFLSILERIGLNPDDHDVDELHAAYVRLGSLFLYLKLEQSRESAKSLNRFDPREPL